MDRRLVRPEGRPDFRLVRSDGLRDPRNRRDSKYCTLGVSMSLIGSAEIWYEFSRNSAHSGGTDANVQARLRRSASDVGVGVQQRKQHRHIALALTDAFTDTGAFTNAANAHVAHRAGHGRHDLSTDFRRKCSFLVPCYVRDNGRFGKLPFHRLASSGPEQRHSLGLRPPTRRSSSPD